MSCIFTSPSFFFPFWSKLISSSWTSSAVWAEKPLACKFYGMDIEIMMIVHLVLLLPLAAVFQSCSRYVLDWLLPSRYSWRLSSFFCRRFIGTSPAVISWDVSSAYAMTWLSGLAHWSNSWYLLHGDVPASKVCAEISGISGFTKAVMSHPVTRACSIHWGAPVTPYTSKDVRRISRKTSSLLAFLFSFWFPILI